MTDRAHPAVTVTRWYRFLGQNIKGNPKMSSAHVSHDLRFVRRLCDILVAQEFEWRLYWRDLIGILTAVAWGTFPHRASGLAHPVRAGQPIMWRRRRRELRRGRSWKRLLHKGKAGISDDRWIRAVELIDRVTKLALIALTTHLVVGGDEAHDGPERRQMMHLDLAHIDSLLTTLRKTGVPIIGQIDGNIHKDSEAYTEFRAIIAGHGGRFYGDLGVEYLWVIDGTDTVIETKGAPWTVPNAELFTDHEGRGLTVRVAQRAA